MSYPDAVEEFLRFDGPTSNVRPWAARDCEIGGHRVAAGSVVLAMTSSANRDPEVFDAPDELRLDRKPRQHLSFSRGPHFCLGASLARVELAQALEVLLTGFPDLRLGDAPLRWRRGVLRSPGVLPLRV